MSNQWARLFVSSPRGENERSALGGCGGRAGNIIAGFGETDLPPTLNGVNYTWHHLDDFDPVTGECTMQLVRRDIHNASKPHTASPKQYSNYIGGGQYGS